MCLVSQEFRKTVKISMNRADISQNKSLAFWNWRESLECVLSCLVSTCSDDIQQPSLARAHHGEPLVASIDSSSD